jgi:hypothetical protein
MNARPIPPPSGAPKLTLAFVYRTALPHPDTGRTQLILVIRRSSR